IDEYFTEHGLHGASEIMIADLDRGVDETNKFHLIDTARIQKRTVVASSGCTTEALL
ncbi:hypothetical protein Tco_1191031, partial [Tanacetum coccineum]